LQRKNGGALTSPQRIPAAQYLRVSTGRQECSILLQEESIRRYAHVHNFEIVATYSDEGRSGLSFHRRPGLVRLLDDLIVGQAAYKAILVHDVSRWGRYQDCDEAAHYEFICKQAGACIHYCAEKFSNDNTLSSSVMKALKRTMAAEYSRELGVRVFQGSMHLAKLGYKQGGKSGYGLARLLISADGVHKQILQTGEQKNVRSDRVLLVPGNPEEVETVKEIYRLVVEENMTPSAITRELIRRDVPSPTGGWRLTLVLRILNDPKYAGCNVWNRSTGRLGSNKVSNSRSNWIVRNDSFKPVIQPRLFIQTQAALACQREPYSREELVAMLRQVIKEKGGLSKQALKECPNVVSEHCFINHFGSLRNAFAAAGKAYYAPTATVIEQAERIRKGLIEELSVLCGARVSFVENQSTNGYFLIDERVSIGVAVCPAMRRARHINWYVDHSFLRGMELSLLVRLKLGNYEIKDVLVSRTERRRWLRRPTELRSHLRIMTLEELPSALDRSLALLPVSRIQMGAL
jgi:DNA invertase Pin-like site-specific DNA recombinase